MRFPLDNKQPWRILFHGTAHTISAFDETSVGRGSEPNAHLGLHLTEDLFAAADYAQISAAGDAHAGLSRVLVVAAPIVHPYEGPLDAYRFFGWGEPEDAALGLSEQPARPAADFAAWRKVLQSQGVDAVDYDDGESPITVVLDPTAVVILGELTVEQAYALAETMSADGAMERWASVAGHLRPRAMAGLAPPSRPRRRP